MSGIPLGKSQDLRDFIRGYISQLLWFKLVQTTTIDSAFFNQRVRLETAERSPYLIGQLGP